ncbi:restriction endonuclease subunit S [uncultured Psychrobacter sp.]|uniref:restriction endonuclease subunit S n=1 Tax=uncultured Psychrobacter sp. TaxID=259303 RepID=UPI002634BD62|nr:restriction endonuclease subunit S [uncultured Psychrobacter sp.]
MTVKKSVEMSKDLINKPEQLITEHIDIWTSAILAKSTSGRGSSKKYELYGITKLRELILELAVRGKLVPQDANEEPASVLLEKLSAEKANLIESGKVKKNKSLPKVSNDEKWFSLPSGWKWVRFGELFQVKSGNNLSKNKMKDGNIPVFGGNGITGYHNESNVEKSTIVIGRVGYYCGSVHLTPPEAWITDNAFFTTYDEKILFQDFVIWLLKTIDLQANTSSTAQPVISGSKIYPIVIPLPPIEEQKRIVAKVDELMLLCDQLEQQTEASIEAHTTLVEVLLATLTDSADADELAQNWARIAEHFDSLFTTEQSIDALKQTVLQLAVMGKLVPQNPKDEPASVLLEKIAEEKEQLIKEKVIKKEKPLPAITDDEKPFELPQGWTWCRLPEVGELARGKSKHRPRNDPTLFAKGSIPLVQTGDVARAENIIETYTSLYNEHGLAQSRLWPRNTLCITIAANIADTALLGFDACFPDSVVGFLTFDKAMDISYFDYYLRTAKNHLEDFAPSTAQKNINLEILGSLLVPLPPLNELNSIAKKVEGLLSLCDQLKEKIQQSQETQVQLTDALVDRALG